MATQLFFLILLILLRMVTLNRLEKFEIWNKWLTECTNLQDFSSSLLASDILVFCTANFPFAQYIWHSVYLMCKLKVFHQICYGCQIPLNVQIRVMAEIITLPNGCSNKMQRNNAILVARSVHHTFRHESHITSYWHESGTIPVVFTMKSRFQMICMPQM